MTMIEKVARAMHDAYEAAAKANGWATYEQCRVPFDDLPEANKATMLASARAGIDAMREPTKAMKECGHNAGWHGNIEGDFPCEEEAAEGLWDKMITKALAEAPA